MSQVIIIMSMFYFSNSFPSPLGMIIALFFCLLSLLLCLSLILSQTLQNCKIPLSVVNTPGRLSNPFLEPFPFSWRQSSGSLLSSRPGLDWLLCRPGVELISCLLLASPPWEFPALFWVMFPGSRVFFFLDLFPCFGVARPLPPHRPSPLTHSHPALSLLRQLSCNL